MPGSRPKTGSTRPEDSPVAWFAELLWAIERNDPRRATEARGELRRLGWSVNQRKAGTPHATRRQAAGRKAVRDE